jgi:DNA-binding HxlR family transcriptional regulator
VLNQRLGELRAAGALERRQQGYALSDEGRRLLDLYPPMDAWAQRWARRERKERGSVRPQRPRTKRVAGRGGGRAA